MHQHCDRPRRVHAVLVCIVEVDPIGQRMYAAVDDLAHISGSDGRTTADQSVDDCGVLGEDRDVLVLGPIALVAPGRRQRTAHHLVLGVDDGSPHATQLCDVQAQRFDAARLRQGDARSTFAPVDALEDVALMIVDAMLARPRFERDILGRHIVSIDEARRRYLGDEEMKKGREGRQARRTKILRNIDIHNYD